MNAGWRAFATIDDDFRYPHNDFNMNGNGGTQEAAIKSQAEHRARLTKGISNDRIYRAIERELEAIPLSPGGTLIDVGCGQGHLWQYMRRFFATYIGVDLIRHEDFPAEYPMIAHNL